MLSTPRYIVVGLAAGVAAGALWGLTFVAPLVAAPFSPYDLTVIRYAFYGAFSIALLARARFKTVRNLTRSDLILITMLGASGNVAYYLTMAIAVPLAGTALVALVIGCLPVIMAVIGNRGSGQVRSRDLALPLGLIAAGLALVNAIAVAQANETADLQRISTGLGLSVVALVLWTWYGLKNAEALAARPANSALDWSALTGLGTLIALVPAVPVGAALGLSNVDAAATDSDAVLRLLAWGAVLGLLSSWLATWLWSIAARRLPVSLAGQIIVSETIFAIAYGAGYQGHWPKPIEMIGMAMMIAGVLWSLRLFALRKQAPA